MSTSQKTQQLQIRVSRAQKLAIQRQAERAGMTMSEWMLQAALPTPQRVFQGLVEALATSERKSLVFADLLDALDAMTPEELATAVSEPPAVPLDRYWLNYLAATVELAASRKGVRPASWTREVAPLDEPVFGSSLTSLRMHLLVRSPPAFARRNIFIDASVGDRV